MSRGARERPIYVPWKEKASDLRRPRQAPEAPLSREKIEAIHGVIESGEVDVLFQPIVDARTFRIHAYEVLARSSSSHFDGPVEMFQAAVEAHRVGELGRLHRAQAMRSCPDTPLWVNVDPHEFELGWLVRPDDPIFRHRWPVCLEITESVPLKFFAQCQRVLAEIRKQGVKLAIDDFGAGFSNVKYIADLAPDVVKLDGELVHEVCRGTRQFRLLLAIVNLCRSMNAEVVAEGIERPSELDAVTAAGVDCCQGYLFARPAKPPPLLDSTAGPNAGVGLP